VGGRIDTYLQPTTYRPRISMSQLDSTDELFCPGCGYSLRGIESARCPECGVEIDWSLLHQSLIPWVHRHKLGIWKAFVRTVWRSSRLVAREASLPVSYRDAQRFRWMVVLVAWIPLALAAIGLRLWSGDLPGPDPAGMRGVNAQPYMHPLFDIFICLWVGYMSWPVPSAALLLFLAAFTGAPAYFFHPGHLPVKRQNRAVALSYYCSEPLALLGVPVILLAVTGLMAWLEFPIQRRPFFQIFILLQIAGWVLFVGLIGMVFIRVIQYLKITTQCSFGRLIAIAPLLLFIWIVQAVLTLGLFPALCGLIKLMILTRGG
jgi:hypothetical protein